MVNKIIISQESDITPKSVVKNTTKKVMLKYDEQKVDKLFGSRTRAKLLRLFFSEPSRTYYIRELSENIKEQVNSIRRELDNLREIGVVVEHNVSNKIYYGLDKNFEHFSSFYNIFNKRVNKIINVTQDIDQSAEVWERYLAPVRPMVNALLLLKRRKDDDIDLLVVGDDISDRLSRWAVELERKIGREINYAILSQNDFLYRTSVRDRFLIDCLNGEYTVVVDDNQLIAVTPPRPNL
jgi:Fe2+ or Zn2+ uptake regulation protein